MKVILLKDVPGLGQRGDVKTVSDGYAANFLFRTRVAEPATPRKIQLLEADKAEREGERRMREKLLGKSLEKLANVRISISAAANEQGHLFKGIHREEIADALKKETHVDLPPECIDLPLPLKTTGEHRVEVKVKGETGSFFVVVSAA